jgi:hypothetical protein
MPKKRLEDAQDPVQGFTPREIVSVSNEEVDTTNWLAFCFPNDTVTYKINNAGTAMSLPAGSIRVVDVDTKSIHFAETAVCEVM